MTYTKLQFAFDLKNLVNKHQNAKIIGSKVFELFHNNLNDCEEDLKGVLLQLAVMEEGLKFEYNMEELEEIANDLFCGKKVGDIDRKFTWESRQDL